LRFALHGAFGQDRPRMPRLVCLALSLVFASTAAAESGPIALPDLQGSWTVLNATMNGRLVEDPKFTGAWRFTDDALT
jgi:hypothetical protein